MSCQDDGRYVATATSGACAVESRRQVALIGPFVGALYTLFVILFVCLAVWPLVATYLGCLLFDLCVWRATRRHPERLDTLLVWIWVIVFAQSLLALIVLGPDAGFHYYLLATIPASFSRIGRPLAHKLLQTGLIVAFFLVSDSWISRHLPPLYPQSEAVLDALRYVNIVGVCAMLAVGAYVQALLIGESTAALRRIAAIDALTGLLNRRSFVEIVEREMARRRRDGSALSLVLGDIDFFKRINDVHGHPAGDHVLKTVASRLPTVLREYDHVARWGGEEFIVLLPDTNLAHALIIAERLRAGIADSHLQFEGEAIPVTMTLGVAQYSDGDDWHAIVARADEALYRGKHAGRNRVEAG